MARSLSFNRKGEVRSETQEIDMNKLSLYGLSAVVALGFASCDGYEEPNPTPQTNPQESLIKTEDVTYNNSLGTEVYDLARINNSNEHIKVASITVTSLPEGYTIGATSKASTTYKWGEGDDKENTYSFDVPVTVTKTSEEGATPLTYVVTVNPDELSGLYQSVVSYNPDVASIELSTWILSEKESAGSVVETAIIGNPDNPQKATFSIKPIEKVRIEEEYYLVPSGDFSKALKFTHIEDQAGLDLYHNSRFQVIDDCTGEYKWQIVPGSVYTAGSISNADYAVWGPDAASQNLLEGNLLPQKGDYKALEGKFNGNGSYQLTVDMLNETFNFQPAINTLWLPGNQQGWSPATAQTIQSSDYVHFWGYAYLDGQFKFTGQPDWNPYNWGAGSEEGKLKAGGDNLNAENRGLHYVEVNLSELTYKIVYCQTYGLIGDATPGGWDSSTALTPNDDFTVWTGTVHMKQGGFKFRANNGWDINLGGTVDNLTPGGDNLQYDGPEADVKFTLDLTQYPYNCTLE